MFVQFQMTNMSSQISPSYLPKDMVDKILKDHLSDTNNFAELSRIRLISREMNNHASDIILNRDLTYYTKCSLSKFIDSYGNLSLFTLNLKENQKIRMQMFTLLNDEIGDLSETIDITLLKNITLLKINNNDRQNSEQTLSVLKSSFDINIIHRLCLLLVICLMFDPKLFESDGEWLDDSDFEEFITYVYEENNGVFDYLEFMWLKDKKRIEFYQENGPLFNTEYPFLKCIVELDHEKYTRFSKTVNILEEINISDSITYIIDIISSLPLLDLIIMTEFRMGNDQIIID